MIEKNMTSLSLVITAILSILYSFIFFVPKQDTPTHLDYIALRFNKMDDDIKEIKKIQTEGLLILKSLKNK